MRLSIWRGRKKGRAVEINSPPGGGELVSIVATFYGGRGFVTFEAPRSAKTWWLDFLKVCPAKGFQKSRLKRSMAA